MSTPEPTDGRLVLTMINLLTGEAQSEVYEVVAVRTDDDALLVRDGSGDFRRWYEIAQTPVRRPEGVDSDALTPEQRVLAAAEFAGQHERLPEPPELLMYREMLQYAFAQDRKYPGQMEHFIDFFDGLPGEHLALLKLEDR